MLEHVPSFVVFVTLLNLAMSADVTDVRNALRDHSLIARTVLSVLVLVPMFALGLTFIDAIPRQTQIALILLAVAPGAPLAAKRATALGGTLPTAVALQTTVVLLGGLTAPLMLMGIARMHGAEADIPYESLAAQLLITQLVPLAMGMALRHFAPRVVGRISAPLATIANLSMLLLSLVVVVKLTPYMRDLDGASWLALFTFSAFALTVGYLLGGPSPEDRSAVAVCSANRNLGLAVLIASLLGDGHVGVKAMHLGPTITVFAVVNFGVSTVAGQLWRRIEAREQASAREQGASPTH